MKKTGKGRGRAPQRNPWRPLYWMPLLTLILCLLSAQMILWGKLPESAIESIPRILGALVGFLGAFRGTRIAPRQGFLWGMLNAAAYGCILMIGNLLFFGEPFSSIGAMFLWILAGGLLGSLSANVKKSKIA